MGIKGLTSLLAEHAPKCLSDHEIKTLFGRKVAIDASMSIYQFLIAVRQANGELLQNDSGETTSHLMGFFYRTIRIVENGLKPCYVFDGKPPELKKGVLKKRLEGRNKATEDGAEAKEVGTAEDVERFSRRTVKVTREQNEECQRLLKLMGIPVVIAPSEAEAQCAELARGEKVTQMLYLPTLILKKRDRVTQVYASASEDMDTLTFGTPILYRKLTFSEAKKEPILQVNLSLALAGLEMKMDQFIDLCILLGCDYLEPIKGIGPKSALKLIKEFETLGAVIEHLRHKAAEKASAAPQSEDEEEAEPEPEPTSDMEGPDLAVDETGEPSFPKPKDSPAPKPPKKKGKKKKVSGVHIPEDWPWEEARAMFAQPDVTPAAEVELEWSPPDVDGLIQFLVIEKGFNEDRVRKGAEKLQKFLNAKQQGRLDGFFTVTQKDAKGKDTNGGKRKAGNEKKDGNKKSKTSRR